MNQNKGFIGFFEKDVGNQLSQTINYSSKFIKESILYLPEEQDKDLLDWMIQEQKQITMWRPANSKFDSEIVEKSPDAIVLYEDIEQYLILVSLDSFKIDMLNSIFQLLDLPPVFGSVFLDQNSPCVTQLYSELLQCELGNIIEQRDIIDENNQQQYGINHLSIIGIDLCDLFLRYPRFSYFEKMITIDESFLPKIEYARRVLGHLNNKIPKNNHVLMYLMYIEILYSKVQVVNLDHV